MNTKIKIPIIEINTLSARNKIIQTLKTRSQRSDKVQRVVTKILTRIQENGDKALFEYTLQFDKKRISPKTIKISKEHLTSQSKKVPQDLQKTIHEAAKRIKKYHKCQKIDKQFTLKTQEGVLSQIVRPLNRVGVYIPGGYTSYPSTVLMDIIPAQIAGVKEIVAVTPVQTKLSPSIAFALKMLKIDEIYQIGGAHAIGALAYGTKSVPPVDKIVGPGNKYVALAKKMVYGNVDIDCVAGPSEVVILADNSVSPSWVALDLLSQAEHGSGDEVAICITENRTFAKKVQQCLITEISKSPIKDVITKLSPDAIALYITKNRKQSIEFINDLAPEHLQIMTKTYKQDAKRIKNSSALFLGAYTPVALGDYFIGTNHVLPTGFAARYASPLGVDSFQKRMSIAEINTAGLKKAAVHVSRFAREEKFIQHALSVERRLTKE